MTTAPTEPKMQPRARKAGAAKPKPKVRLTRRSREEGDHPGTGHWRVYFLEHLIETSNITASAAYAKTVPSRAYRTRKQDPAFAAAWDAALVEGYKNLEMDLLARTVKRHGQLIDLLPREFRLLECLMRHAGQVVTRTMLLEKVWDYHFDPQTNVIDVHVSRLRQKIDKGFDKPLLHTVRGAGYRLHPEPA